MYQMYQMSQTNKKPENKYFRHSQPAISASSYLSYLSCHSQKIALIAFLVFPLLLVISPFAKALEPVSDEELSEVYGKGLYMNVAPGSLITIDCGFLCTQTIDNTDKTFVRVGIDAPLALQANINTLNLGYYDDRQLGYNNGVGWDVDLDGFDIGRGNDLVANNGLYFELVYNNYGTVNEELVGWRLGMPHMRGDIGIDSINILSGTLMANLLITITIDGHREDGFLTSLADALAAGVGLDDTTDFWIANTREDVVFEYLNTANYDTSYRGFSLHLTDNVGASLF